MLEALGLSATAESVYREILADPELGIDGLCGRLARTEAEVRAGLDELARFTLVRESRDNPGTVRPVRLDIALDTLLRKEEEDLARRQLELASAKSQFADLVAEYADPEPSAGQLTRRLLGLDAIQAEMETLARTMTTECLSVMPGGAQSQASLDASRPLDQDALRRGAAMLTLFQDSARNDAATREYARWLTGLGGQVRTAPVLPTRMLIVDRKTAMIPIDPADTRAGALRTSEPGIVSPLVAVFEHAWNTAVPLGADSTADTETGLTPLDKELLRLLGTGLTDEAAGKRLGVSARTVRRQMTALMERLNASSRFEAGLKAGQRGWL